MQITENGVLHVNSILESYVNNDWFNLQVICFKFKEFDKGVPDGWVSSAYIAVK